MKIKYNILWLDDEINEFVEDGWIEKITQYLADEGFEPNIVATSKIDVFFSSLDDSFDLILTDFHMASKNGDEIVKDIRDKNIQTEILFYTAKTDLQAIEKIDRITFLETINDHHSEVADKAKALISLTIRKFQNIISMRGMIMHETSALDNQMAQILLSYYESGKVPNETVINSICSKLEHLLTDKQKTVASIQKNNNFKKLIKDTFLFSSEYKIEAMKDILQNLSLLDFTDDYKTEVSSLRNKFAHAILETDKITGRQYFKSGDDDIPFDESSCRTIRKNINKHKKSIDDLDIRVKDFIGN
jgi:CheY-like chemotaxis protein